MNDDREYDLHTYIEDAWASYQADLGAFLAEMPVGENVTITAESGLDRDDGDTPWIRVDSVPDEHLTSTAVLSSYLYVGVEPPTGDDDALQTLGWVTPAEGSESKVASRSMLVHRRNSSELASAVVAAFRHVWRVIHPAFLSAHADGGNGRQFRTAADRRQPDSMAILPLDIDHLRALMLQTLSTAHLDTSVEVNGDIAIGHFALPIHVCFAHDATTVRLHAPLVTGVQHSTVTSRKMSQLNTRWQNISFVVAGGQLFAALDVPTQTFVPRLLMSSLFSLGLLVDRIDAAFALALGGSVFDPTHHHPDPLPKVNWSDDSGTLGTLRAACELTGGPVDIATVDALCRTQDLVELTERARWSADRFRGHAHRLGDDRRIRAAVLCDRIAAAWQDVSTSLERATEPKRIVIRRGEQIQLFEQLDEPALFDV